MRARVARDESVYVPGQRGKPGGVRTLDLRPEGVKFCWEDAGGKGWERAREGSEGAEGRRGDGASAELVQEVDEFWAVDMRTCASINMLGEA